MRVLFAGTPAVALVSLQALLDSSHEVVGVLTRPPAPMGRRRVLTPSPVHAFADERGVPVITADRPHQAEPMAELEALRPDVAAVVAYGALLREPALSLPVHGWVNLHFSLLPAWRGAAPVQHAIRAGDTQTGVSTFRIEAGLDTGPLYAMKTEPIRPWDTAGDLLERMAVSGAPVLVSTLDTIAAGGAEPRAQATEGISHAPRILSADAQVPWSESGDVVDRLIRASTPAPGAWTTLAGARVKIGPVRPEPDPLQPGDSGGTLVPGELTLHEGAVLVGTGSLPVRLSQLAPAGKGWMDASDWARGARLEPGTRFEWSQR